MSLDASLLTDPLCVIREKPRTVGRKSGAVAVISLRIGHNLWTANLGDCRAILTCKKDGNTTIIQLSEDAKPDTPRFTISIEKRGGWVAPKNDRSVARVNEKLAIARAFGDKRLVIPIIINNLQFGRVKAADK